MKKIVEIKKERKKGLRTSLFVHGVLVVLALLPFLKEKEWMANESMTPVEIQFVYDDISSGSASTAPKEIKTPVEKIEEVVEKKTIPTPPVVSAPVLTEEATEEVLVEDLPDLEEEVVIEEIQEEVAEVSEKEIVEEVTQVEAPNSDSESKEDSEGGEGDKGEEMTGKKLGTLDFDGEGVFGRKVIHRADVKKITEKEGKVVINLCINREGMVTHVAFNRDNSSINDSEYVKRAMDVASDYKFEKDYSAPATQCGKLSFIFHIK